jgi:hypothetical protein
LKHKLCQEQISINISKDYRECICEDHPKLSGAHFQRPLKTWKSLKTERLKVSPEGFRLQDLGIFQLQDLKIIQSSKTWRFSKALTLEVYQGIWPQYFEIFTKAATTQRLGNYLTIE